MRKWHRWFMTVFAVLLMYWVVSGLLMAIYDATDNTQVWAIEGGGPGARLTDVAKTAQSIPDPQQLNAGIQAALAKSTIDIASVDLRMTGDIPRLQLAEADGDRDNMERYYAANGETMTQRVADAESNTAPAGNVSLRNTIKMWHKGNIGGIPGQLIGLLTGLGLIAMSITGIIFYLQLWKTRRRNGRSAFFWSSRDGLWRRLHRWISIVSAAFILNIAISGTIVAFGEIQLNLFLQYQIGAPPYPRPTPLPTVSNDRLSGDIITMLQTTYTAALQNHPASSITAIELVNRDGVDKGIVTLGGEQPSVLAFDPATGTATTDRATSGKQAGNGYFADWHQLVKRLHRGDIIGHFSGRYIDIAAGFALLYLVISGIVMYFDLKSLRNKQGRSGWFWS